MNEYNTITEAVLGMAAEHADAEHFIMHPSDVEDVTMERFTDARGDQYFLCEGFRVYITISCPPGVIGVVLPDPDKPNTIGQA